MANAVGNQGLKNEANDPDQGFGLGTTSVAAHQSLDDVLCDLSTVRVRDIWYE